MRHLHMAQLNPLDNFLERQRAAKRSHYKQTRRQREIAKHAARIEETARRERARANIQRAPVTGLPQMQPLPVVIAPEPKRESQLMKFAAFARRIFRRSAS